MYIAVHGAYISNLKKNLNPETKYNCLVNITVGRMIFEASPDELIAVGFLERGAGEDGVFAGGEAGVDVGAHGGGGHVLKIGCFSAGHLAHHRARGRVDYRQAAGGGTFAPEAIDEKLDVGIVGHKRCNGE